jgi:ElaB/YqjD/DUF883 family membrane-anchored ribosome-binding protein
MGEAADQIRAHIEQTRSRLGQDLNELESSVRREADWRVQFNRRPWAILGTAFAVGLLIGIYGSGD